MPFVQPASDNVNLVFIEVIFTDRQPYADVYAKSVGVVVVLEYTF